MEMTYVWAVVITGLVVVFSALILLVIFVSLIGKCFTSAGSKKKEEPKTAPAPKPQPVQSPPKNETPPVSSDEDEAVIAAIMAAVAAMGEADGKKYKVKSVRRAANSNAGRSAWAMAGLRDNTSPF